VKRRWVIVGVVAVLISATVADVWASDTGDAPEPLVVVEHFLAARDARDADAAMDWCAPLLELQDVDGSWFTDAPTTRDWLRQLTDKYQVETLGGPVADGHVVSWTERLTLRNPNASEPWLKNMTLEVHAVVRDGKIGYLSAPYPALPLRQHGLAGMASVASTRGAATTPTTVAPATLVVAWAAVLGLTVLSVAGVGRVIRRRGVVLEQR